MIEVVYKEEKQEANAGENIFHVPRNIRQIGLAGGNVRIYIEGDLLIKKVIARMYAVLLYLQEKPNGTAALLIFS